MNEPKIFQRKYTRPVPPGAKILRRRGGRVAQFTSRGRVQEAKLTAEGDRILCASKNWFVTFEDGDKIKHTIKAFPIEDATRVLAEKVKHLLGYRLAGKEPDVALLGWFADRPQEIQDQLITAGLLDPANDQQDEDNGLLLDDLIAEFEKHLTFDRERTPSYIGCQVSILTRVFRDCEFHSWDDITLAPVKRWLQGRRDGGAGISKRTYNQQVQCLRQFTRFVVEDRELAELDPLRKLKRLPKMATDKRHPRRILTPQELQSVLVAAQNGPERQGLDGPTRALVYWFMSATGIRRGECRSLVVSNLRLSGTAPCVRLDASYTKNGKDLDLPLNAELAQALRAYASCKLPTAPLFHPITDHLCSAWKVDLEIAGIPFKDASGEVADVHSLRHYYGTRLAESGLNVHEVQKLMRHADISTTQRYFHADAERMRKGVEALPKLSIRSA